MYNLLRSLDLDKEVEEEITLADLAAACSPATRVALGVLRFCIAAMASAISGLYVVFGVVNDTGELRWLGAVRAC